MFHRRLLLLAAAAGLAVVPLAAQLARLSIARGDELREQAEARLIKRQWLPTSRGAILDRKGRVLAQDRPSYDVQVEYEVITGAWAEREARQAARRSVGVRWADLSPDERDELIAAFRPAYRVHLESGWDELARRLNISRTELDKRRDEVMARVASKQDYTTRKRIEAEVKVAQERGDEITEALMRLIERRAGQPIAEQGQSHSLATRVADATGFSCQLLAGEESELELPGGDTPGAGPVLDTVAKLPGLVVLDGGDRDYPYERVEVSVDAATLPGPLREEAVRRIMVDGVACHILGRIRDRVFKEDADARAKALDQNPAYKQAAFTRDQQDRGAYRDGDRVGDLGVEGGQELALRGLRGLQTARLDTGEKFFEDPVPGTDVRLTLDIMLQARVQAAMTPELGLAAVQEWHQQKSETQQLGEPLFGAAVVLDVDTGDVLAMVSTPTFTRDQVRTTPNEIFGNSAELLLATPWLNRAISKPYQPGSIVKPLLLCEAVKRGVQQVNGTIACTGHLYPNRPTQFRCWIYKQFGTTHDATYGHELDGAEAVMASCNIFFFTLGRRLGPQGVLAAYQDFAVGQRHNLGLTPVGKVDPEFPGTMGLKGDGVLSIGDATQMGIGQGPVAWTPLHAADSYATLARGGVRLTPRIVVGQTREEPRDLNLNQSAVAASLRGLDLAVNDTRGTGHALTFSDGKQPIFNAKGVKVWGKTGTAASSPVVGDPDGEGPDPVRVLESGDHSWFVVLAGRDRPRYAIAVVIDFGGSGGKVSGPITNQIIHALIVEGYL